MEAPHDHTRSHHPHPRRLPPRPLRWLWPGRIPLGKLTILSGDPSLGKSLLTLDLAARVSTAREWPDAPSPQTDNSLSPRSGNPTRQRGLSSLSSDPPPADCLLPSAYSPPTPAPGRVLLLAAEDDIADTIRPRLHAAGADLSRIHVLEGLRDPDGRRGFVSLLRDCDTLADLLRQHNDWRLIIIDPVSAYFDGLDPNSNADVRTLLGRLADLAEDTGAALLLVSHHRKGGYNAPAIHKTIGSLAFAAVARVVWNVLPDPATPNRRLLVPVKMNLGPPPTALAFQITTQPDNSSSHSNPPRQQGPSTNTNPKRQRGPTSAPADCLPPPADSSPTPVLLWHPHPIEFSPDDPTENAFAETDEHDRLTLAKDWLRTQLRHGPRPSADLKQSARHAGISLRTLWHAKRALAIPAVKDGPHGQWHWAPPSEPDLVDLTQLLPPFDPPPPPPPPKTVEEFLRRYPPSPETLAKVRAERERRRKAREAETHGASSD